MTTIRASVLVAAGDGVPALGHSVRSALAQTVDDIEVLVVGNGVSDDVRAAAADLVAIDDRVRFFDNPRIAGLGEAHLVRALAGSRGEVIGYLLAGDLWLPTHLDVVSSQLADADVVHTVALTVAPGDRFSTTLVDLNDPADRRLVLGGENRVALSTLAHTADAYRKLPYGWRAAPSGTDAGHHMLEQFLAEPWVRARSSSVATAVTFTAADGSPPTPEAQQSQLETWVARIADPLWRGRTFPWLMFEAARSSWRETDRQLRRITQSAPWQAADRWARRGRKLQARLRKYS